MGGVVGLYPLVWMGGEWASSPIIASMLNAMATQLLTRARLTDRGVACVRYGAASLGVTWGDTKPGRGMVGVGHLRVGQGNLTTHLHPFMRIDG